MAKSKHFSKSRRQKSEELRALVLNLNVKRVIIPGKTVYFSDSIQEGAYAALIRDQGLSDALQGSEINEEA